VARRDAEVAHLGAADNCPGASADAVPSARRDVRRRRVLQAVVRLAEVRRDASVGAELPEHPVWVLQAQRDEVVVARLVELEPPVTLPLVSRLQALAQQAWLEPVARPPRLQAQEAGPALPQAVVPRPRELAHPQAQEALPQLLVAQ
jgi:hypothetical protein